MNEYEFQQRSLGWARRSFWVGLLGLLLAVIVFAWTLQTAGDDRDSGTERGEAATATTAPASPETSAATDPAQKDEEQEAAVSEEVRDAHPLRCCAWYSIGSSGTAQEVSLLTLLKTTVFAAAVAIAFGIRDRWRFPGQDRSSCSGVLVVCFTAVVCSALAGSAAQVSEVDPPGEVNTVLALSMIFLAFCVTLVVGMVALRLTVRVGVR